MHMESLENIVEYYDELYPVSDGQKSFFGTLLQHYEAPARLLRINCASGAFEHALARDGYDVTGTDASRDFIDTAVRRKRIPNADVRFFQMTPSEIGRFLAKSFYQCLYMLEDALYFIGDKILFRKFFFDCRKLLAPGGSLVLHMPGFPQVRESIRVKLLSVLKKNDDGTLLLSQHLEREGEKFIPVRTDVPVYMPPADETERFAKEAGFNSVDFYTDWEGERCGADKAAVWVLK